MLVKIRTSGDGGGERERGDLVTHLVGCHERIRRFCGLALRLAEAEGVDAGEIAQAANAVHRYFTLALPLHAEDEDLSVRPRLEAARAPADVLRALERMTAEHGPLDAVIAEAAPAWREIAADPTRLIARRGDVARTAKRLDELFRVHLEPEERLIFPAIRLHLAAEVIAEIEREVKARREKP